MILNLLKHNNFVINKYAIHDLVINIFEGVRVMVFNATFNNILVTSWWLVLLVKETGVHGENHRPAAGH
jgi:hypothetical protein